jgi:hypothetical protein
MRNAYNDADMMQVKRNEDFKIAIAQHIRVDKTLPSPTLTFRQCSACAEFVAILKCFDFIIDSYSIKDYSKRKHDSPGTA